MYKTFNNVANTGWIVFYHHGLIAKPVKDIAVMIPMNKLLNKFQKIGRSPEITAKAVGLKYFSDRMPGYTRHASGRGFCFRDAEGKLVKDRTLIQRFRKMVIPPAYTSVWICPVEHGHLQFTGIDAAGRKQYRYHQDWNNIRNQTKYYRMQLFASYLPAIRKQVNQDLSRKDNCQEKVVALVIRLMELTGIRIGNESYQKLYGSFGLTTLQDRHVKFNGTTVSFSFKGKKGVYQQISLKSRKLANLVKQCRDIPGKELFQYYDDEGRRCTVDSGDVNNYLKAITGEDFTAKDFRTWVGSVSVLYAFKTEGCFQNITECRKKIISALDQVALNLGNTRAVCKKYYVHPKLIQSYEEGKLLAYLERLEENRDQHIADLNSAEKILLEILLGES